jgi:TctA family transporter
MALATALLCGMLFLIALAADLNIGERLAPLVVVAAMCGVMGVAVAQPNYAATARMPYLMTTGGMVGTALLLQMLHARRWKLWAVVLLALGGFIGWRTFVLLT